MSTYLVELIYTIKTIVRNYACFSNFQAVYVHYAVEINLCYSAI